jgi:excisionase family DNA binding protein
MTELGRPEFRLAYTVEQVCKLTNMGRNKFYQVARAGKLKVRKDGKINLVLHKDLEAYLEALPPADYCPRN